MGRLLFLWNAATLLCKLLIALEFSISKILIFFICLFVIKGNIGRKGHFSLENLLPNNKRYHISCFGFRNGFGGFLTHSLIDRVWTPVLPFLFKRYLVTQTPLTWASFEHSSLLMRSADMAWVMLFLLPTGKTHPLCPPLLTWGGSRTVRKAQWADLWLVSTRYKPRGLGHTVTWTVSWQKPQKRMSKLPFTFYHSIRMQTTIWRT